ncbi:MAG: DUF1841 family protein [Gammaproteobacteria bacterium]|nr:DUF1841 family protein [Gammaproteobacteria bacterium]
MFGNDRNELRRAYYDAWQKAQTEQQLTSLELMIAEVVQLHPEYHKLLEAGEATIDADFNVDQGQSNPFLHMGMHIAIREQVSTDRPTGIALLHQQLSQREDHHQAEHQMMECLGEAMWNAQRSGKAPDEQNYLECLYKI